MATTSANVAVGSSGEVHKAPAGTTIPTDSTTAMDAAFVGLGYNSSNGVGERIGRQTTTITAWQNGDEVLEVTTSHTVEYTTELLETSSKTLETYYGNFTAAGGKVEIKADLAPRGRFVIEVLDRGKVCRIVIPDGQVFANGDVNYQNAEAVSYPIRIKCFPDSSGVKAYKYYGAIA